MRSRLRPTLTPQPHLAPSLRATPQVQARTGQTTRQTVRQQLRYSPQQQQAVKLLQYSSAELAAELSRWIDENPFLLDASEPDANAAQPAPAIAPPLVPTLVPKRSFSPAFSLPSNGDKKPPENNDFRASHADSKAALQASLVEQLARTPASALMKQLVTWLIDRLEPSGYLPAEALDELSESLPGELARNQQIAEKALQMLQDFEPTGVGARDLAECLLSQLAEVEVENQSERDTKKLARLLVSDHLKLLALPADTIQRRLQKAGLTTTESHLAAALSLIKHCQPYPAEALAQDHKNNDELDTEYIVPDLLLEEKDNRWAVKLNPATQHIVQLDESLFQQAKDAKKNTRKHAKKRDDRQKISPALRQSFQQAQWLVQQLARRQATLLDVAGAIVERQQAYFSQGAVALKPLKLDEIANALEMHPSTISRSVQDKYLLLPKALGARVIALKSLFSKGLKQAEGEIVSATAIGEVLRQLIRDESPQRPLSDQALADRIGERGIEVARRTVTKYRERLKIPASPQRRAAAKSVSTQAME